MFAIIYKHIFAGHISAKYMYVINHFVAITTNKPLPEIRQSQAGSVETEAAADLEINAAHVDLDAAETAGDADAAGAADTDADVEDNVTTAAAAEEVKAEVVTEAADDDETPLAALSEVNKRESAGECLMYAWVLA